MNETKRNNERKVKTMINVQGKLFSLCINGFGGSINEVWGENENRVNVYCNEECGFAEETMCFATRKQAARFAVVCLEQYPWVDCVDVRGDKEYYRD